MDVPRASPASRSRGQPVAEQARGASRHREEDAPREAPAWRGPGSKPATRSTRRRRTAIALSSAHLPNPAIPQLGRSEFNHVLGEQGEKQTRQPVAKHRMVELAPQLAQWLQSKPSMVKLEVRNLEMWIGDHPFAPEQNVQVDRARAPLRRRLATQIDFNLLQDAQQLVRRQIAFHLNHGVEVPRLRRANRRAVVERRAPDHRRAINSGQCLNRSIEPLLSTVQVGPEPDVDFFLHCALWNPLELAFDSLAQAQNVLHAIESGR